MIWAADFSTHLIREQAFSFAHTPCREGCRLGAHRPLSEIAKTVPRHHPPYDYGIKG